MLVVQIGIMHIKCPEIQIMYKKGQTNPELMYTKMKYMLGKHDAWRGAMVWPHRALVKNFTPAY